MTIAAVGRPTRRESLLSGWPGYATSVGYSVQDGLKYDEYRALLDHLLAMQHSAGWWLGDLLLRFEGSHGQAYLAALPDRRESPARYQACRDAKWVARQFELSRRRDKLSFSHHREVAPLEPDEQDLWLGRAEENRWGVHRLREELRAAKRPVTTGDGPDLMPSAAEAYALERAAEPHRPSAAERMVDAFLGGGPAGADEPVSAEPGSAEFSGAPAPRLPSGSMVIPADAELIALAEAALFDPVAGLGLTPTPFVPVIPAPVVAAGRAWCPIRIDEEPDDAGVSILAVRVMLLDIYIEKGYGESTPVIDVATWRREVGTSIRPVNDFAGLEAETCEPRAPQSCFPVVFLRETAIFRGRRCRPEETREAQQISGQAPPRLTGAFVAAAVVEAGTPVCTAVPDRTQKPVAAAEEHCGRLWSEETSGLTPDEVDEVFVLALMDAGEAFAERFMPAEPGIGWVRQWELTLTAMARHIRLLEGGAESYDDDDD